MKYAITEEQFLIYHYGEKKALFILKNNLPDHYRTAYHKLQNGGNFGWNWAAFFFGSLWFIYQGMPLVFFAFFISMWIITAITNVALGIFGGVASLILFGILAGALSDNLLINRLSKKLKNGYFGDLHPDTQNKFIEKMGVTEEQYLTFIYGEEKAQSLIKYNIPNHYREAFKKISIGQKYVWNWSAGIFSYAWFIFRRLPHLPLIAIFFLFMIGIVLGIIQEITQEENQFLELVIINILSKILFLISCMFANYFLINYISKQIRNSNFDTHPKGGNFNLTYINMAIHILIIILAISYSLKTNQVNRDIIVAIIEMSISPIVIILSIIAIIHNKFKIRQYKKSLKEKS